MISWRVGLSALLAFFHFQIGLTDYGDYSHLDAREMGYIDHEDLVSRDYHARDHSPPLLTRDITDQPYARNTLFDELARRDFSSSALERRVLSPETVRDRIQLVDLATGFDTGSNKDTSSSTTGKAQSFHVQKDSPTFTSQEREAMIKAWKKQMNKDIADLYAAGRDTDAKAYRNAVLRYVRFEKSSGSGQTKASTSTYSHKAAKEPRNRPRDAGGELLRSGRFEEGNTRGTL